MLELFRLTHNFRFLIFLVIYLYNYVQWMAPEVLSGQTYSEKADIYSVGIVSPLLISLFFSLLLFTFYFYFLHQIIWEILTGKCPFEGMNAIEVG